MNVVLARLRHGGLKQVLEGMQQDRQKAFGQDGPWKQAWRQGQDAEKQYRVLSTTGANQHSFSESFSDNTRDFPFPTEHSVMELGNCT